MKYMVENIKQENEKIKETLSFEEEEDIRKKVIVLLLSGAKKAINSKVNFQKELFLLVKSFPNFQSIFGFIPHRLGPYSNNAEFTIENHPDLFEFDKKGLELTIDGRVFGEEVLKELSPEKKDKLLKSIKLIRSIYDQLTDDEFMFLIYKTYGYTINSDVFEKLMKKKDVIATRLYKKGVVTYKRYKELLDD